MWYRADDGEALPLYDAEASRPAQATWEEGFDEE